LMAVLMIPVPRGLVRIGQEDFVSRAESLFREDLFRMDHARHGQAILQLLVLDAVPPDKRNPCLGHLVASPLENLPENGDVHLLDGKGDKVHGRFWDPAHGIDIAQGVGRGDLPEPVGVIHDGREEIDCLYKSNVIGNLIHPRVVGFIQPDQHMLVRRKGQSAQGLLQVPWRQFGGSPRSGNGFRQSQSHPFNFFHSSIPRIHRGSSRRPL